MKNNYTTSVEWEKGPDGEEYWSWTVMGEPTGHGLPSLYVGGVVKTKERAEQLCRYWLPRCEEQGFYE